MKTVRYYIAFENLECAMSTKMEISKAQYTEQLKHLRKQVKATETYETPLEERPSQIYDHPTTTETVVTFVCACAYADLIKIECKDGYYFKNKR